MPIVITSSIIRKGTASLRRKPDPIHKLKRPRGRLVSLKNKAVRQGIIDGLTDIVLFDLGVFSRTVARKTGKFRRAVEKAVIQVASFLGPHTGKTVITWEAIIAKILEKDDENYFKYHIRSRGFYVNPTVKGTFPLRYSRFAAMAKPSIRKRISQKLRALGIQDRVVFSV